tara:strand:- start:206 stop:1006 length:801 start_codon:yes stop_codon:yes gene_type:complete
MQKPSIMSRFKKGDTVYDGRGENLRELIIAKVHRNFLIPITQYTFEAPYDGFACGEQSIRGTKDGRDLTMSECLVDDKEDVFRVNTIASARRTVIGEAESCLNMPEFQFFDRCRVDFKPSLGMCKWIRDYAEGRMIIHIDSGQGHLVRMLKMAKAKAMGIEKYINKEEWIKWRKLDDPNGWHNDINEILQGTIQQQSRLIETLGNKALLVFARPKDSESLNYAINNFFGKSEILLIETGDLNDTDPWKKLEHEGVSEDNEVVYSLK